MVSKVIKFAAVLLFVAGAAQASSDINNLPVNLAVANISNILYFVAFIGGALMILSPCSAATLPAYFASSFGSADKPSKFLITKRTITFFSGFALVYAFIGAGASFIGRILNIYQEYLSVGAGVLLIAFALLMLSGRGFGRGFGHGVSGKPTAPSYKRIFVYGLLFAVGFSGCAGPILAGILTVAVNLPAAQAILLMLFYSLGMGVPLVLLSLFFDKVKIFNTKFFQWHRQVKIAGKDFYLTLPNIISGILLALIGIVFIVYRSTFVLSGKFPRALTDAGYALQDKLLQMNIPPYVDMILFVVVGFVVLKLAEKYADNIFSAATAALKKLDRLKAVLIIWVVVNFLFNQVLFFNLQADFERQAAAAAEAARPAEFELIVLTANDCDSCYNLNPVVDSFKSRKVKIKSEQVVDFGDDKAKEIIAKYNVKKVPTFIAIGEVDKDKELRALLGRAGTVDNNTFVFTDTPAPYIEADSGKVRGLFNLIYLTDKSCEQCYDVSAHKSILARLGLNPVEVIDYDISSADGRKLVNQYNINKVPTIILDGDMEAYNGFAPRWQQVGTVENDGKYVFRQVQIMGTYKDLQTRKIVEAKNSNQANGGQQQNQNVIVVNAEEFSFSQSNIKLKKGQKVTIRLVNQGGAPHDFVVDELGIKSNRLRSGEVEDITFTPDKVGKFAFYCSVPGHRQAGMEGVIEVVE